jgi:predicted signal transduction protein with EAL and GGDEF domain
MRHYTRLTTNPEDSLLVQDPTLGARGSNIEVDTLNSVFSRADKALYQAKKSDKGRCILS